ncbi:MAG TPA: PAS domain S-box protein [Burkholderiales bacterium]
MRTNYAVRAGAFAYSFLAIGLHLWQQGYGPLTWTFFALQFLAYPHLVYWRATRSAHPTRAELDNLYVDSTLLGAWVGFLGFPTWIGYGLLASTMLNATVNRGLQGAFCALGASAAGAALAVAVGGLRYAPATGALVSTLCFFGILAYTCAVGYVVYRQNRRILRNREELRSSEAGYRLITENAGDLVAMVDPDSRWLYASPSYERLLDPEDLEPGTDAFRRLHPDDADRARVAVLRVASTGKPRELALRLADREGRVRQYRTRVQAVAEDSPPRGRILLVSQDVTDLRESEERLLLAGHALEGMTEAIIITGAGGVVQTVNRAFCEITGYSREEVVGKPEKSFRNDLQPPEFHDDVYAAVAREGHWAGTRWSRRKNGSVYREWRSIRAVRDAEGATTHYVIVFFEARGTQDGDDPQLRKRRG